MTQSAKSGFFGKLSSSSGLYIQRTNTFLFHTVSWLVSQAVLKDSTICHVAHWRKTKKFQIFTGCFAVDCLAQLKKKAVNASPTSPCYVVSIQLPGYTSRRHKATIVLIVFWDKYSSNCPFSFKSIVDTTYYWEFKKGVYQITALPFCLPACWVL